MSQLVLVRCTKCKRRFAQHGDAGCPFCALDSTHGTPPTPKVLVRGDAIVEVVRPQPPRHATPPPRAATTDAVTDSAATFDSRPSGAAAPSTTASSGGQAVEQVHTIGPEKRRAIVLRPSGPIRLGPIVLPRRVWMSIVALALLVAGSVAVWEVTQGDPGAREVAATVPAPSPSDPSDDEAEAEAFEAQQSEQAPPAIGSKEAPVAAAPGSSGSTEAGSSAATNSAPGTAGDASATAAECFRQGTRYFMDSNLGAAQAQFEAAIALDQGYCAAHRALGVIHATRQDGRRSVEAYRRYLQCSPRVADDAEIQRRIATFDGTASAPGDGQR